ncbi:MAG: ATP-binding cassette domain-containing protein [Mesorhizobium sp.]|uniref:sugar ABC transporter ATP-binding protein n=1 Tax=unclassified Mesorhizobium TaxID=325217 RepID=UPI000FE3CD43|nr:MULTISPECIES: sugar ABC transporter ATP-binding protein [unclassified Mesorhizobium]RWC92653.1 MAG: sugar ABC transporter ATP-binding protein [Mesorhizobium sp.]RWX67838.1 sugar ABC transporter ATP-binding protein [Mesorhizobium sp. M4B.F.Ca.ET.089.01.1.1]TIW73624.1 MAG: ATP-binding cassette domain-containing protein [Mesorhizobium sp.]
METPVLLKISGLSKSFGPVRALRDVGFELRAGEIHAIAGENGAGKSTLMKVIDGILAPDSGDIQVDGRSVSIPSPLAAQKLGIGFVHQEIALCPDISVAENIFMSLTNASKALLMNYRDLEKRATAILARLGNIDPAATVRNLSISQQQLVEIAKALTLDCRILIFDEPTAALTEREAQKLFEIIHQLAGEGIGIIYISHRMAEIFDNCDRVTVLRDGRYITTLEIAETTPEQVVASMVGRVIDSLYPEKLRDDERSEDILLEIAGLCEATAFRDISFQLRKGEILGIGGLIGAGRSEIVKGICRLEGEVTGDVILRGKRLSLTHYGDSIAAGIVYLSEDRKGDGLFLDMSIAANISALAVDRIATRSGLINERREKQRAETIGKQLSLKCGHVGQPVSTLSGGNQQKVAIAKMLSVDPKVIFLDEPTRGVDVGAKAEIHRILRGLARDGVGIVVISSELPELIGICDRVLIVREGRITGEVAGAEMTEENIMVLASLADEGRQRSAA